LLITTSCSGNLFIPKLSKLTLLVSHFLQQTKNRLGEI
jgi:hypothetical protein